tara:strand:- start:228 stop:719 length:492 start_codon:yes stop_codon:yes gene_type:complete
MKGLAKKNNKTRGKRPRRKNNKKTTRKVKIRGGRERQYYDNEPNNANAYIDPNEHPHQEQPEELAEDWADHIHCPHDNPEYRRHSRFHPDAQRYENVVWHYFNQSNDIPQHLKDNKNQWMDICHNGDRIVRNDGAARLIHLRDIIERRQRNGGKKRKTYKKRK